MLIGPAHQLAVPCMRSLPRVCTLVLFIFSVSILPFPVKYLPPHLWNVWLTVGVTLHAAPSPEGTACPAHPDDEDQIRPPPGPRRPLSIPDTVRLLPVPCQTYWRWVHLIVRYLLLCVCAMCADLTHMSTYVCLDSKGFLCYSFCSPTFSENKDKADTGTHLCLGCVICVYIPVLVHYPID